MEANSKNLRDIESVQLSDSITSIARCYDYVAVGCLDDTVSVWRKDAANYQLDPYLRQTGNAMGIIDLCFNKKSTILATSCMDSTLRIYDLHTREVTTIECEVMENWKIQYVDDFMMIGGDYGRLNFYDSTSKERTKRLNVGEIFLTALATAEEKRFVASGNNNGEVHIVNMGNKDQIVGFKPHHKLVRDLAFAEEDTKLLTASDDGAIKMIDVASEKVVQTFEGHKLGVTSVNVHQSEPRVFFSTSFDKTIKIWDLRNKACVGTTITGSPLWDCKSVGKQLLAGGDNGVLMVYSVE